MKYIRPFTKHNIKFPNLRPFTSIYILWTIISLVQTQSSKTIAIKSTEKSIKIPIPTLKSSPTTRISAPPLRARVTTETSWIQGSLERHNYYRSLHRSQPLKLNTTLNEISQSYANYLLQRAIESYEKVKQVEYFEHNVEVLRNHSLGENLYYVVDYYSKVNASLAVNLWYNEIKDYDFKYARVKATSHPKSLIAHKLPNNQTVTFVVANYYPAGNVHLYGDFPLKLFLTNVLPPISDAENEIEVVDNENVIRDNILYWDIPTTKVTTPKDWIEAAVAKHNDYRREFNVPEISLSDDLCKVAQSWANTLLKYGISDFNKDFIVKRGTRSNYVAIERAEFGENLLYFISDGEVDPSYPARLWYEEKRFYDFEKRKTNKTRSATARTDHFEQVIWKSSSHMGIAFASGHLENGQILTFICGYYYPNSRKSFEERVENIPYENNPTYATIQQLLILLTNFKVNLHPSA